MEQTSKKPKVVIGCDPGVNGGFVVLAFDGDVLEVTKTPPTISLFKTMVERMEATYDIRMLVKEKIHSRPTNGAKANFTIGFNVGVLDTSLMFSGIPFVDITPQTWMKSYMLKKEKSESSTDWKNRLKDKASRIFSKQKITLWSADAFLIAEYCRIKYGS